MCNIYLQNRKSWKSYLSQKGIPVYSDITCTGKSAKKEKLFLWSIFHGFHFFYLALEASFELKLDVLKITLHKWQESNDSTVLQLSSLKRELPLHNFSRQNYFHNFNIKNNLTVDRNVKL